ncbi:MAG: hypothetical protein KJ638_09230 [Chloroflexi bacterium]|nr:hypothetical protein [Chloroflexota bacterium]
MEKDVFDYIEEEEAPKPVDRSGIVWNILTVLVLLAVLCVGLVFLTVFLNPYTGYNPFPPPTMPVRVELDTPTPTPHSVLPPTWTLVPTIIPTNTSVPEEPEVADTPVPTVDDTGGETDNDEPVGGMPVVLHDGSPNYIPAMSFHPDLGCNWMGVAGQVLDVNGAHVQGLIIEVGGTLAGKNIGNPTILQATGLAVAYGDAGYEVKLADEPLESTHTLWIQVLDQAGLPLSDKIYFDTYQDCDRNLIIIYLKQVE